MNSAETRPLFVFPMHWLTRQFSTRHLFFSQGTASSLPPGPVGPVRGEILGFEAQKLSKKNDDYPLVNCYITMEHLYF